MKKLITLIMLVGVLFLSNESLAIKSNSSNETVKELYKVVSVSSEGVQGQSLTDDTGVWLEGKEYANIPYMNEGELLQVEFLGNEVINAEIIIIDDYKINSINYDEVNNIWHYGGESLSNNQYGIYLSSEDTNLKLDLNTIIRATTSENEGILNISIVNYKAYIKQ